MHVLRETQSSFDAPVLIVGAGACGPVLGVGGARSSGHLAGNGLLTATTLGRLAGQGAAAIARAASKETA